MAEIEVVTELPLADQAKVIEFLDQHGRDRGFIWDEVPFSLVMRENDAIIAGLSGKSVFRWLYIDTLGVAEEWRGRGLGRRLMLEAEHIAGDQGFYGIWLNTFSFQAPEFYKKLGYEVFGTLNDFPPGEARYFLAKRLQTPH